MCERLAEIRGIGDSPGLQLVHCVLAALDAQSRFVDPHPTLVGVRAAGWTIVPAACAGIVVALALARGDAGRAKFWLERGLYYRERAKRR